MEFLRFFCVSLVGVVVDIAIAYTIVITFDAALWLSAAVGFISGALINYVLHELWTFKSQMRKLSKNRAAYFLTMSSIALIIRLTSVIALEYFFSSFHDLAILVLAVGISFCFNYLSAKFLVFSSKEKK
nr:GtrA family protein [Cytophagales bacterium]